MKSDSKQITIRNVKPELARRLKELSRQRAESVNTTVLYLLNRALSVDERRKRLERYVIWEEEDFEEFEKTLADQRAIDESLWE